MRWWRPSCRASCRRSTFVKLSREFAEIDPVVAKIKAYREVAGEIADLEALIADPKTEAAMREMADDERQALADKRERIVEELRLALLPKDAMDERNVIVEIRAGTGGDEASLFAGDLFRMYERYAARQGWTTEILSLTEGTKGGFKEIVAEIRGRGPFARLKFESGVHRVQRVPDTEAQGPHPHLGRDRRGAARGRGRRHRDQARRSQDRHHAVPGRRRPARQQDRIRRSASPTCRAASS